MLQLVTIKICYHLRYGANFGLRVQNLHALITDMNYIYDNLTLIIFIYNMQWYYIISAVYHNSLSMAAVLKGI